MRHTLLAGLVLLSFIGGGLFANPPQPEYRDGYLLVRFNETGTTASADAVRQAVVAAAGGGAIERMYSIVPGLGLVKIPAGADVKAAQLNFAATVGVAYAEPDYLYRIQAVPNDPRFGELWGLRNTGQTGGTSGADIKATAAWDITTGSRNVIVAVLDSGIDYNHPDLAANMWTNTAELNGTSGVDDDGNGYIDDIYGYDFWNRDGDPMDDNSHGTHVAGTIGAVGNNSRGVVGVNWQVKMMALKIGGSSGTVSNSAAIEALQYARQKGAHLTNNSWGGGSYSQALYDAINACQTAGILFVAAAGNNATDNDSVPFYPASYDLDVILSVLATDHSDKKASFSNWGKTTVDVAAPGNDILSTLPNGGYGQMSGTSMASPHVAGCAALLKSIKSGITYSEIKQILIETSDAVSALSNLSASRGRVNLQRAVQAISVDILAPTPNPAQWDIEPAATGTNQIVMSAKTATDPSGVEYQFECLENSALSSGWQTSAIYVINSASAETTYTFRLRYRDKSPQQNIGQWSEQKTTATAAAADTLPPAPSPARWGAVPRYNSINSRITMAAATHYDQSGVQYKFECVSTTDPAYQANPSALSSAWLDNTSYTINNITLTSTSKRYTFRLLVRDKSSAFNQTAASEEQTVIVAPPPQVRNVPYPYATIQAAIDAANDYDTVVVKPGVYRGEGNRNIKLNGKAITVRSENPDNPAIVAQTIIDPEGTLALRPDDWGPRRAFIFDKNETRLTVVSGFTIRNAFAVNNPQVAPKADQPADGASADGGAIYAANNCSPTLLNMVIQDCYAYGQDGRRGNDGKPAEGEQPAVPGEDGGNGGSGRGGAMYFGSNCKPLIQNVSINGTYAYGGDGGDGGNAARDTEPGDGGDGSNGLGGAFYFGSNCQPDLINVNISNARTAFSTGGNGGQPVQGASTNEPGEDGQDGEFSHGGAIYAESGSIVKMTNCAITQSTAQNGIAGAFFAGLNTELTAKNCRFESNTADENAGGFYLLKSKSAIFENCQFVGNTTSGQGDGGAINYVAASAVSGVVLDVKECEFTNNRAGVSASTGQTGAGGAVNINVAARGAGKAVFSACRFKENQSEYGGAVSSVKMDLKFVGTTFGDNYAEYGAGVFWADADAEITDCRFEGNTAIPLPQSSNVGASGGALYALNSGFRITSSLFIDNQSSFSGGAVVAAGPSYWLTPVGTYHQDILNSLFVNNQAGVDGGALAAVNGAAVWVSSCTLADNLALDAYGRGGAVSCGYDYLGVDEQSYPVDFYTYVLVDNSILWNNQAVFGAQASVGDPLKFYNLPSTIEFDHCDIQGGIDEVYLGQPMGNPWAFDAGGNLNSNPLFVKTLTTTKEFAYFLSQQAVGQQDNSPCVDAGLGTAAQLASRLGYDGTTRTDRVADAGTVDMGYHYKVVPTSTLPRYKLKLEIYRGPASATLQGIGGGQTDPFTLVAPGEREVLGGTVVLLQAALNDTGYYIRGWKGTDNDASVELLNQVTVTSDVTVQLVCDTVMPSLWIEIEGSGSFIAKAGGVETSANPSQWPEGTVVTLIALPSDTADAVKWTNTDDDTLPHQTNSVTMTASKDVKIKFYRPNVYNVTGDFTHLQHVIDATVDGDIIIIHPGQYNLVNARYYIDKAITIQSYKPDEPTYGGGVEIIGKHLVTGSSTTAFFVFSGTGRDAILNGLTFRNVRWTGMNGCDGKTDCNPMDDGANGVSLNGGVIRFEDNSSATIKNCRFLNNMLVAGNGGKGAQDGDGGWGGWARGGAIYVGQGSAPRFINCEFIDNSVRGGNGGDAGSGGAAGRGGSWDNPLNPWRNWDWGPYQEHWKYSGYGGAVYCDFDSAPEFADCLFRNNVSYGGQTGVGDRMAPWSHFKIDRFGGAVYVAKRSKTSFSRCVFEENIADTLAPENAVEETPYFAFGGAVAYEDDAALQFTDCVFNTNAAHHGGALYGEYAKTSVVGGLFEGNTASFGGAIYYVGGVSGDDNREYLGKTEIDKTVFKANSATAAGAQGGAIFAFEADSLWTDVEFLDNVAAGSGGGAFLAGSGETEIKNALFARNNADADGGGLSNNWYNTVTLQNCTFANNQVNNGKGGGLFCGYNGFASVIDSIFWGNTAPSGRQIALSTGKPQDPAVSVVEVSYTNIQPSSTALFIDTNCTLVGYDPLTQSWPSSYGNIGANPLFVVGDKGDYYLSQISAGQPLNSPSVDTGSAPATAVGLDRHTTATNSRFDSGTVDMGYHYPLAAPEAVCRFADLASATNPLDSKINMGDLLIFAGKWLNSGCGLANNWCTGADYTFSGNVNFYDFAFLSECWMIEDLKAPTPNPSVWTIEPRASGTTIEMAVQPSTDNWSGEKVYYYFENITDPAKSSGWRQNFDATAPGYVAPNANPNEPWRWINTGLQNLQTYNYRAYVRDLAGNQTQPTVIRAATAGLDSNPPSPNPAQWAIVPYQSGAGAISMTAATATDAEGNGVEYRFVCTSHPALTSGWRQSVNPAEPGYTTTPRVYEVTGLTVGQTYTFYTISRDRSPNQNQTGQSPSISVTIVAGGSGVDLEPPTPNPAAFTASSPFQLFQSATYWHVMAAEVAEDPSGVEYRFVCVDNGSFSSGWRNVDNVAGKFFPNGQPQTPQQYWVQVGVKNLMYRWTVQYRDRAPTPNVGTASPQKQITNTLP